MKYLSLLMINLGLILSIISAEDVSTALHNFQKKVRLCLQSPTKYHFQINVKYKINNFKKTQNEVSSLADAKSWAYTSRYFRRRSAGPVRRERRGAHEQLGRAGGHVALLVQLPARRERALDIPQRQAARHPRQPDHPNDRRRHGVQRAEPAARHRLQQRQAAHQRVRRRRRGRLPRIRGDRRELHKSSDGTLAAGNAALQTAAHRRGEQHPDLPDGARRRRVPKVPGLRGDNEPGDGRRPGADVAEATVQRDILHDRHVPGGLDVREVLLAEHPGGRQQPRRRGLPFASRRRDDRRLHHRPLHVLRARVPRAVRRGEQEDDGGIPEGLPEVAVHLDGRHPNGPVQEELEQGADNGLLRIGAARPVDGAPQRNCSYGGGAGRAEGGAPCKG